jgi:hypothetical protein
MHRAIFATIGDPAHRTWQITSPSITQPATKSVRPTILTPANDPKYMKLFEKTTTPEKIQPQIKTSVSTIFF